MSAPHDTKEAQGSDHTETTITAPPVDPISHKESTSHDRFSADSPSTAHREKLQQNATTAYDSPSHTDDKQPVSTAPPKNESLAPEAKEPDTTRRQSISSAVADTENHTESLLDAAWDGNLEAVTRALQNASPKSCDSSGMTPLHLAAERDHLAVAMLLLDRGVDVNTRAERGRTALHLAARSASADMVEMLLERAGADVNAQTSDGKTALHYAASSATDGNENRREVVRVLRDWDADPTIKDRRGDTPRDVAQKRDHWDAAATLRRAEKRWEEKHHQTWLQRHGIAK